MMTFIKKNLKNILIILGTGILVTVLFHYVTDTTQLREVARIETPHFPPIKRYEKSIYRRRMPTNYRDGTPQTKKEAP